MKPIKNFGNFLLEKTPKMDLEAPAFCAQAIKKVSTFLKIKKSG